MRKLRSLVLVTALAVLAPFTAQAAFIGYGANLSPANEVPPVAGSLGTGLGFFVLDDVSKLLTWDISFSGLSAPINTVGGGATAHIHNAPAGSNGGVVIFLDSTNPGTLLSGEGLSAGRFVGSSTLSPFLEGELAAGRLYVNFHTAFAPGGEIRGQILPAAVVPLPAAAWLLAPAALLLAGRRRRV